jgi:hypothetical protein
MCNIYLSVTDWELSPKTGTRQGFPFDVFINYTIGSSARELDTVWI